MSAAAAGRSRTRHRSALAQRGVSLVELAIGLLILSLIIGGLLIPLATQVEQARVSQTQRQIEEIREALVGFALANGRLPCPAAPNNAGVESVGPGGACNFPWTGFVPGVTLGLSQVDAQGYAIDGWSGGAGQNRIRYAVTTANGQAFTTAGGMRATGMAALAPDLLVCSAGNGAVNIAACPGGANTLAANAVAVIYSLGANAATGGISADEGANANPNSANNDRVFVSRIRGSGIGGEYDDIMTWLSPNVLYARMVAAGQLP